MKTLVIATRNEGKLREFSPLLAPLGFALKSAGALGLPEPEESAPDFAGNARIKALAAARGAGLAALADDSGLSVAALGGAPGVHSARYAGGDYPAAFARILKAVAETGEARAHFTAALCLALPDGTTHTYVGEAHGHIAPAPRGAGGFGYDPIFIPDGYEMSFAELGAEKERISHRAKAFAQLAAALAAGTIKI
ncbi:RdgB/HAM1 family non-canonical purine NTP pyrophosphatase [Acidocella sp.]|uniref:RdgB/HAM1 family non-canonical purine NTP pyrophosphatase n=2 Tax=Acidocella sp. TaxID=50710 RepID=UPI002604C0E8|nr:RdgB/HAM1 family non-canonical purine NTP pyrophosphatase [Acidocella sp.]